MEQNICWLTGLSAKSSQDFATGLVQVESEACGRYVITESAMDALFPPNGVIDPKTVTQGHINCARHSLEIQTENKKQLAAWTTRNNVKALQEAADAAQAKEPKRWKLVASAIEDYFEEPVDHAEKPLALLSSLARKLERKRAFAAFHVESADTVWARVVDEDELAQLLLNLDSEKLIEILSEKEMGWSLFVNNIYSAQIRMTPKGWDHFKEKMRFREQIKFLLRLRSVGRRTIISGAKRYAQSSVLAQVSVMMQMWSRKTILIALRTGSSPKYVNPVS